jgi:hypothetical protein
MRRRREIRLADAEIDDVPSGTHQFRRAGEDREGVFLADTAEGGHDGKHGVSLSEQFFGFGRIDADGRPSVKP